MTARRGMSLIEAVFAMAMLGIVAGALMGALGYLNAAQQRERDRLAAMEVAHRLLLQHMDDPSALSGNAASSIEYDGSRYAWRMRVERVPTAGQDASRLGRLRSASVQVWPESEPRSGGKTVTLSRFYDAIPSNPGATMRASLDTDKGRRYLLETVIGELR